MVRAPPPPDVYILNEKFGWGKRKGMYGGGLVL
jgi:hypothetical protein